jgi:hypothetical protein
MTLDDAKTLAEIIAILLAGSWAIYGYFVFRQREKAFAELKHIELETRKAELELRQTAIVKTYISTVVSLCPDSDGYCLMADVTLINQGKRDTRLKWKGEIPAFSVRRVVFNNDGTPTFPEEPILLTVRQTKNPNNEATSHIIRAGGEQTISFALLISRPGVYFLSFRGVVAPDEKTVSVEAGASPKSGLSWTATKYVVIRNDNVENIIGNVNG